MTTVERMIMDLLVILLFILGFILGNHSWHNRVNRPTEDLAFRNIEKEERIIKDWGHTPNFTDFETKIYFMDLEIRNKVIPEAEKHNKINISHSDKLRVPIVIYEIANVTSHTPDYIQRVMDTIDSKVWLRQRLGYKQVLPEIKRIKI